MQASAGIAVSASVAPAQAKPLESNMPNSLFVGGKWGAAQSPFTRTTTTVVLS